MILIRSDMLSKAARPVRVCKQRAMLACECSTSCCISHMTDTYQTSADGEICLLCHAVTDTYQKHSQLNRSVPLLLLGLGLLLLSLALLPGLALLLLQLGVLLHGPVPPRQPEHIDSMLMWPHPCYNATCHLPKSTPSDNLAETLITITGPADTLFLSLS